MTFITPEQRTSSCPSGNRLTTPDYLEALVHKPIKPLNWRKTLKDTQTAQAIAEREEHFRAEQEKRKRLRLAKIEADHAKANRVFLLTYLKHPNRPDRLCRLFAEVVRFSFDEIKSDGRRREPTYYRQILMWILKKECHLSSTKIALMLGGRDHTTSLHACKKINSTPAMLEHAKTIMKALLYREQSVYGRVSSKGTEK